MIGSVAIVVICFRAEPLSRLTMSEIYLWVEESNRLRVICYKLVSFEAMSQFLLEATAFDISFLFFVGILYLLDGESSLIV